MPRCATELRQDALVPSPFRRVAPQVVEHGAGWRVQVADRYHVEYVNGSELVQIAADLEGPVVRLRPSPSDSPDVVQRIVDGLRAMDEEVVVE